MSNHEGFDVAYEYTVRFYPRYFTWVQFNINRENSKSQGGQNYENRLTGPLGMGPEYKVVVAINDDTIYAEAFVDVSDGPVILTIPAYPNSYSILQLDVYGNIFSTELSANPPSGGGVYGFVQRGSFENLPEGVTRVELPYPFTTIAIRTDKYSSSGTPHIEAANVFRSTLQMQTLANYDPTDSKAGRTLVLPLFFFSPSVKLMADEGLAKWPESFLTTLQEAMAAPSTQPLTDDDRALMQRFNTSFAVAKSVVDHDSGPLAAIIRGAQAAYAAIINRWQSHRGPTNWIHFDNVGHWGENYLDRAALTEYIQVGNDRKAAYYANAFVDDSGLPLDGGSFAYTIQFTKEELPEYKRFWSMTAYTPEYIELVPNEADKYVVASYTDGLVTAEDGSVTIYVQADKPKKNTANWLPVPKGHFSLLFRVYGPLGSALAGTYVPPKIHRTIPHP